MITYYKPWSVITENGSDVCKGCHYAKWTNEPDGGLHGWACNADNESQCEPMEKYAIDLAKLENISMSDVIMADYPDFSDAFIESADYNGYELSKEAIEWLNEEKPEFVHEQAHKSLI